MNALGLSEKSGLQDGIVGVGLNGVPIYNGYSDEASYDALLASSRLMSGAVLLDSCLGGLTTQGLYKYHSFSQCMTTSAFKSTLTTPTLCNSDNTCKTNPLAFARANTDANFQTLKVVGIAKDGHQILGPFKQDGSLWQPCDVDICNGLTINGSYYYAMTSFYPYTVGCWGPVSSSNNYNLACTTNQRVCSSRMLLDSEFNAADTSFAMEGYS